ncbi:hypothetical protein LPJ53_004621 [Coemansia erecta]|uniref:FHA domain-containing protein n=1 Tax=Coemansia erecta TaxID=147472 RepID=A0A9W8CP01_9FUNG|nr:hypothetical protein LPJ53_004621 [Coemansia erecta]
MSQSPTDRKRRRSSVAASGGRRVSVSPESSEREQQRHRSDRRSAHGRASEGDGDSGSGSASVSRRENTDEHSDSRLSRRHSSMRRRSRTEGSIARIREAAEGVHPQEKSAGEEPRAESHQPRRPSHRRHASSSAKLPASASSKKEDDHALAAAAAAASSETDAPAPRTDADARRHGHSEKPRKHKKEPGAPVASKAERHGAAGGTSVSTPASTPITAPATVKPLEKTPASRPAVAATPAAERQEGGPNFGLSGKLAAEANTVNGVVLKYTEPAEARRPKDRWRIYVFKDDKDIDMHHIDTASAYLFGRDRKVADIPIDHPSCSSQHAVLQPYLIDLNSTNGSFLNGEKQPPQRFIELRSEDVIRFGFSTREYVILRE